MGWKENRLKGVGPGPSKRTSGLARGQRVNWVWNSISSLRTRRRCFWVSLLTLLPRSQWGSRAPFGRPKVSGEKEGFSLLESSSLIHQLGLWSSLSRVSYRLANPSRTGTTGNMKETKPLRPQGAYDVKRPPWPGVFTRRYRRATRVSDTGVQGQGSIRVPLWLRYLLSLSLQMVNDSKTLSGLYCNHE